MNDARSQRAAFGKLFEVKRERVGERARMNPGGGVDDHAGGLVDDDDLRVFVNDVERDVFGREFGGGRRGDFLDLDALARAELVRGLRGATADEYVAFFNRALEQRAAHALDARGEEGVESRPGVCFRSFKRERFRFRPGERLFDRGFAFDARALAAHARAVPAVGASPLAAASSRFARRRRRTRKMMPPTMTKRLISCEVESPVRLVRPRMSPRGSSRTNSMRKRIS